ncbi:hypothetical protein O181_033592 [Austropuccinia psidii MF-1]|uniref:Uncharacterized protein n=1 Tax=Austropuccinia psidii MF-1 TaxID=1389203 RepID=A0A9Q3D4X4_9BASI|nr:hypothetical protein [Austropuccinia psidii MF-1]
MSIQCQSSNDMISFLHCHPCTLPSSGFPSNTATTCPPSPILTLWDPRCALMICVRHCHPNPSLRFGTPLCSHDFPPTLPPLIHPHPSLRFCTPMAYHPHTPAAPS